MKKVFYFFMALFLASCSLDVPNKDQITGLLAIDNVFIADETLSGVYLSIPKNRILFSKLSDDFYPKENIKYHTDDFKLYQWKPQRILQEANAIWKQYYRTITKANVLLQALPNIVVKLPEQKQKLQEIHAQTLCLKALCYFELVRIFAPMYETSNKNEKGIILKDKIIAQELPQATLEETYREIVRLLEKSFAFFSDALKTNKRFSKLSAKALLSKVYLFWRKYDKAISFSKVCKRRDYITGKPVLETIQMDDFRWIFPIDQTELKTNKKIQQRKGWEKYSNNF